MSKQTLPSDHSSFQGRPPWWRRSAAIGAAVLVVAVVIAAVGLFRSGPDAPPSPSPATEEPSPQEEPDTEEPGSEEPGTEEPSLDQAQRLGLHYTDVELEIWRERAEHGPYREEGDVSDNSPGDWERISSNAEKFLDDPEGSRWEPDFEDCIPHGGDHEPSMSDSDKIRDAAFYALVTDDGDMGGTIVDELVSQATAEEADFGDEDRFCPDEVKDSHPHYVLAQWLTKMLYAFDYTKQWASDEEQEQIRVWFHDAASFLLPETEAVFDRLFEDRQNGDYTPANEPDLSQVGFYGSKETSTYSRHYNNRWGNIIRFIALVGVDQSDDRFLESGKRWVKEFVVYSVYPDGWLAEFRRWLPNKGSNAGHELGYTYTANILGQMITVADALARTGDTELYDFETSDGLYGTQGGPKSLQFAIESMGRYLDGTYERYGTDKSSRAGDDDYRIDSVFKKGDYHSVHDVMLTPANLYYESAYIQEIYTRTGDGMPGYPEDEATNGPHTVWAGESGTLPGVLFMFGGTEDLVDPYPG